MFKLYIQLAVLLKSLSLFNLLLVVWSLKQNTVYTLTADLSKMYIETRITIVSNTSWWSDACSYLSRKYLLRYQMYFCNMSVPVASSVLPRFYINNWKPLYHSKASGVKQCGRGKVSNTPWVQGIRTINIHSGKVNINTRKCWRWNMT